MHVGAEYETRLGELIMNAITRVLNYSIILEEYVGQYTPCASGSAMHGVNDGTSEWRKYRVTRKAWDSGLRP